MSRYADMTDAQLLSEGLGEQLLVESLKCRTMFPIVRKMLLVGSKRKMQALRSEYLSRHPEISI